MVRIVHVTDHSLPRLGGSELHVAGLALRQAAAGHDVSVLSGTDGAAGPARIAFGDGPSAGPRTVRCGGARWGSLDARSRWLLADADVAHVHLGGVSPLGWAAVRERCARGEPLVVTVHSLPGHPRAMRRHLHHAVGGGGGGWRGRRGRNVVWLAVGPKVAAGLRELVADDATVRVVPCAVEPGLWTRPALPPSARRPGERLVVAALRHTRRKRVEALPRILDIARREVACHAAATGRPAPRVRAVIAGEGSRTQALQRALIVHGMAPWVDVPGRLSQASLRDLYGRADVFVSPADRESFGVAALEARAAGLPVVARRDGGAADLLVDGVEALLADDDAAAGRALGRLLWDAGLRGAIAAHNRTVPVVFTWEATTRLVDRAYALAAELSTAGELALQGPAADAGSPPRREGA